MFLNRIHNGSDLHTFRKKNKKPIEYFKSITDRFLNKNISNKTEIYSFQTMQFKIYLDLDMEFYMVSFDEIPHHFVYEEDDMYDQKEKGIPTFLKFQIPDKEKYNFLIPPNIYRFKKDDIYTEFVYQHNQFLNTNHSTMQDLNLNRIDLFDHNGNLIKSADKKKLIEIGFLSD